jgi:soluble lytic murein transglycosylase-like protein
VDRNFAASPYPVTNAWLATLARGWGLKVEVLKHDACWTARASAYVMRYEINLARGDFWEGIGHYARSVPPGTVAKANDVAPIIAEAAHQDGLDPALISAVVEVESGYQAEARSPKGALGLMQLMPGTGARYGVAAQRDLLVPSINIAAGARYLADLYAMFGGDLRLTLAAFNAGEGAVVKYGLQVPPFAETQQYVQAVTTLYGPTFRAKVYEASLLF